MNHGRPWLHDWHRISDESHQPLPRELSALQLATLAVLTSLSARLAGLQACQAALGGVLHAAGIRARLLGSRLAGLDAILRGHLVAYRQSAPFQTAGQGGRGLDYSPWR